MARSNRFVFAIEILPIGLAILVLLAGFAAADSHLWTNQADFQSGTLTDLSANAEPGSLVLERNATAFSPYSGNPVLVPDSGGWDNTGVIPYSVLRFAGTWVMWYTGFNGSGVAIGRATSMDRIHWTRTPSTPLLTFADWPVVLYESGVYKMWYEYAPGPYMPTAVYYATSTDGIHWAPYAGNPVLSPSASGFDSFIVTPGGVVHDAAGYRMWYSANDGSSVTYAVGLATSPDGINWTRYGGNPVITPPFGGWWDAQRVIPCVVLPWNGGLIMGYIGADSNFIQRIALATSADGIHWTPFPAPTLDLGGAGSWDAYSLTRFALFSAGGNLTMWYGGSPTRGVYDTGLATAPSYAPVGTFTSSVFDSGNSNTTWVSLAWTGTTPPNTAIGAALQVGNTSSPDLTWTLSPPSLNASVSLSLPKARFARLIVALASEDPTQTPTLDAVTVTYQPPPSIGFFGLGVLGLVLLLALVVGAAVVVGIILLRTRRPAPSGKPASQAQATTRCPQCGSPVPVGNPFCGHCGAAVPASGEPGPPGK